MSIPRPTSALHNEGVRLEPLTVEHAPAMRRAVTGIARDSFGFTGVPSPESVDEYIAERLAQAATGTSQPYAQFAPGSDELVGHTSHLSARFYPDGRLLAVEVGYTWLVPIAQGTAVNSAAKLLLFTHAFEEWGAARVDVKTDARNAHARAAIAAVGATFEGVLRNWQASSVADEIGRPRDTAMFSIIAAQWPAVKERLSARVAAKLHG